VHRHACVTRVILAGYNPEWLHIAVRSNARWWTIWATSTESARVWRRSATIGMGSGISERRPLHSLRRDGTSRCSPSFFSKRLRTRLYVTLRFGHPEAAMAYEEEKRRARQLHPNNSHACSDEKTAWVQDRRPKPWFTDQRASAGVTASPRLRSCLSPAGPPVPNEPPTARAVLPSALGRKAVLSDAGRSR
jgi:hypothetical protein